MTWTLPTSATTSNSDSVTKSGHSFTELQSFYTDGDSVDAQVFAEMRSGVLLVSGEHYQKRDNNFFRRLRDTKELTQEQKLRLTKNHIRKITQVYANNIMAHTPGVGFSPKDENSVHDQKVADLHHSVWRDAFEKYSIDDLMDDWCDSFVELGEVAVKIFFDPSKGQLKGYEPIVDEMGQPRLDEMGQPQLDESKPIYSGEFVFEEIYGFNLLRPIECKDLKKAEWLCARKMVSKDDLLHAFPGEDKKRFIQESVDETYMVFDVGYGGYQKSRNQVLIREFYFRPCAKYPQGYFYYTTKEGVLAEGELPGGIFPIIVQAFDKVQTTPRGRGPVKQMRPYQAEINRTASKIAEHQITLGDDKLLIQNGTKVSASATLPGIRAYSYTGAAPTVLEGRSGAQYLDYMNSQITEMYAVMNVQEDSQEQETQLDPYVLLFRSARQKKKFQRYIKRFEKFLINIVKTYISLAKIHLSDDALIYAIGKSEQINIPEFKQLPDLCYEVKVEAQADDIETKLGKQIVLNHALQYIGPKLKDEDIGKIMRAMPFANFDESFDDMTIDYDSVMNEILSLDRGEQPPVNEYDNHLYCIKRLVGRMRKADFKFLSPEIQQNYSLKVQMHQQFQTQQALALQRAEQGFIPTSGYLVACDLYVSDPSDPKGVKSRRVRVPSDAVSWLIQQLEAQGMMVEELSTLPQGAQAQMADQFLAAGGGASPMSQGPAMRAPSFGSNPRPRPAMGNSPMGQPNGMGALGRMKPAGMG